MNSTEIALLGLTSFLSSSLTAMIGFGGGTTGSAESKKALERLFSPEFRNRLDGTVYFAKLNPEVIRLVVDKFLTELEGQLQEKNVALEVTDAAKDWFAVHGYDEKFGARPMARKIQDELKVGIADELLFGELQHGGIVNVDISDGKITLAYTGRPAPPPEDEDEGESKDDKVPA